MYFNLKNHINQKNHTKIMVQTKNKKNEQYIEI